MIKNYFKIAVRNLLRNKGFSFINIIGLAIGMASAILIFLWIANEISHERFHEKKDRLYVVNNRDKFDGELHAWNTTVKPLAPLLKRDYPDVEDAVRYNNIDFLLSVGDKHFNVRGAVTDSGFLNVFSFPLLEGNASKALSGNNTFVISQKLAKQLFGNEEAMGKTIRVDSADYFIVSGVLKNLPNNTNFGFQYLLPWTYFTKIRQDDNYWTNNSIKTYVLLKPNVSQAGFDAKIKNIIIQQAKAKDGEKSTTEEFTQLVSDTWLYSKEENGKYIGGRIEVVKLFSIIAVFILLIACINFMNLSTARSEKRAKEVGIRKAVGAQKSSLIVQFIGESMLLSFLSAIVAILIV